MNPLALRSPEFLKMNKHNLCYLLVFLGLMIVNLIPY